jgi:Primase C terminal 1 (PriCT-1)
MKCESGGRVPVEEWRRRIGSAIPEGQRNDTLARISGHLLAHRIDPYVCLDIILSLNATHCHPPLPEEEIAHIVASITNREFAQRATLRRESNRG